MTRYTTFSGRYSSPEREVGNPPGRQREGGQGHRRAGEEDDAHGGDVALQERQGRARVEGAQEGGVLQVDPAAGGAEDTRQFVRVVGLDQKTAVGRVVAGLGQSLGDAAGRRREQDRQERRGTDRAAVGAEEVDGRRRRAHVRSGHLALRERGQRLHRRTESRAHQGHAEPRVPQRAVHAQRGEHEHRGGERADTGDEMDLEPAGPGDHPARQQRHREVRGDRGQGGQSRRDGAHATDELEIERQRRHRTEHADADDEVQPDAQPEGPDAEQAWRKQRGITRPPLHRDEHGQPRHADRIHQQGAGRAPPPDTALLGDRQQWHQPHRQGERPGGVSRCRTRRCGKRNTRMIATAAAAASGTLIRKIPTADRLAAFGGVVPAPHDSGETSGNLRRPQRYHRRLQHVFYTSALVSSWSDPNSKRFYDRKRAEGKSHIQAVLALARRRVNVLWALIRDRRCYQVLPPAPAC